MWQTTNKSSKLHLKPITRPPPTSDKIKMPQWIKTRRDKTFPKTKFAKIMRLLKASNQRKKVMANSFNRLKTKWKTRLKTRLIEMISQDQRGLRKRSRSTLLRWVRPINYRRSSSNLYLIPILEGHHKKWKECRIMGDQQEI